MAAGGKRTLPAADRALLVWADDFRTALAPLREQLGFPAAVFERLTTLRNVYAAALTLAEAPATRTSGKVTAKNVARREFERELRQAIGEYLTRNHLLTDENREDLGLPVRDATRTRIPAPKMPPSLEIKLSDIRQLKLYFKDPASERKAKPYGVSGAVVVYDVRETAPKDPEELSQSLLATRSPYKINFREHDRGRRVYIAACWQTERGRRGPWSEVATMIIP
jgi:hypothetical protein